MKHFWSAEQYEYLAEIVYDRSHQEITELFNERFNLDLPRRKITAAIKRKKLKTGRTGAFEKGKPSWNKGMKGLQLGGEKGWFKKGQLAINHRPVGSERVSVDGYVEIKIAEPNKWMLKHKYIWEQAKGKVPDKHCLIFLDSNRQNVSLDNLALISRAQLARMNQNKLFHSDPELTKTGVIIAELYTKIGSVKRKDSEKV